jgi:hypothetical protein
MMRIKGFKKINQAKTSKEVLNIHKSVSWKSNKEVSVSTVGTQSFSIEQKT